MIVLENVTKTYPGNVVAVDNVSLEIRTGETFVLVGTSGCGKTTTMKLINRLVDLTSGSIFLDGKNIHSMDSYTLRRSIGYVIQNVGLFPHFTIERNVGVVPELIGWNKHMIRNRVRELLHMVGLDPERFSRRYPNELSGGQQQRVGVARALAADPDVILMDEPFGALDPITRETLQDELSPLWNELDKTVVFVTHDIFEAVKIGDRIGVMNEGKLLRSGIPGDVIDDPRDEVVASFFSQHRFQLELLTMRIEHMIEQYDETNVKYGEGSPHLHPNNSLVDAMDALKRSSDRRVPVYDSNNRFLGIVTGETIMNTIAHLIENEGS
jgi:osmoprotectant transport system ATP-binding protein